MIELSLAAAEVIKATPAVVNNFVNKVSGAIGTLYEPTHVLKMAKAEAKAEIIKAGAQIEISEIQRRAFLRLAEEEGYRQSNMENIANKAITLLNTSSQPENVEDDWITNFFDKCRIISDEDMQNLWARILAGESNQPGSFSRKTINIMSDLGKQDADLFRRFCGFVWMIGDYTPLIFDEKFGIYKAQGLNLDTIIHLESLGLVEYGPAVGFLRVHLRKVFSVSYFGKEVKLTFPQESDNQIDTGIVMLTSSGKELSRIANSSPIEGFYEFVYDRWSDQGLVPPRDTEQS